MQSGGGGNLRLKYDLLNEQWLGALDTNVDPLEQPLGNRLYLALSSL